MLEQLDGGAEPSAPTADEIRSMSEAELRGLIDTYEMETQRLQESLMAQQALFIDNMGWEPLGADRSDNGTGIRLDALKRAAELGEDRVRSVV